MSGIENARGNKGHDPDSRYGTKVASATPANKLDSEENLELARQFENWWIEARDRHAASRVQRMIDHDYYDHDQLTPEDIAVYEERGQAPVTNNLVHTAIDWLAGTERRTRIDWKILPRGPEDEQGAKAQTHLLKYISDANRAGWERSRAFKDAITSGVGFVEEFMRLDGMQEPVGYGYQDWRFMWWDPYSRDNDFKDCRYMHRAKFVDLDYAIAMCPERAADLRAISVAHLGGDVELLEEMDGLPAMFAFADQRPSRTSQGSLLQERYARRRVRLIETWYRRPVVERRIHAKLAEHDDLHGMLFDKAQHGEMVDRGIISLVDALTSKMHMAIWSPGVGLCKHAPTPYSHNEYPFTAVWGFRHHRDGMPYGFVRGMRDAQDEYNKRRAKALYAASVNRVLFESDAFDEEDERDSLDEISRMNGEVRLAPGGLKKIQIDTGMDVAMTHVNFMEQAKQHIFEGSGITRENLGQESNAISGRAILAKQQQGAVTTAEVFDNFRMSIQVSGEKLLENIRVGMSLPRKLRIMGENEGFEWLALNQPYLNDTGEVAWDNDVLNTKADFVVADQDFRETVRLALSETLMETVGKLPPEMAIQLMPFALELADLPNKQEMLAVLNRMAGNAPQDPAQAEQAQVQAAHEQRLRDLAEAGAAAKVERDQAAAQRDRAQAKHTGVKGQREAVDTAGLIAAALPIAPIADTLYAGAGETPPNPVPPGVQQ